MMTNYSLQVNAFHGTIGTYANEILENRSFRKGNLRRDHWLGQGVYFFREDQKQAMIWADYKVRGTRELHGQDSVVVKAVLRVMRDEFFNLDSREDLEKFERFVMESLIESKEKHGLRIDENQNPHVIRCALCDQLPDQYKLIQMTFLVASKKLDSNPYFRMMGIQQHGVQLCVRDTSIIDADSIVEVERKSNIGDIVVSKQKRQPRMIE